MNAPKTDEMITRYALRGVIKGRLTAFYAFKAEANQARVKYSKAYDEALAEFGKDHPKPTSTDWRVRDKWAIALADFLKTKRPGVLVLSETYITLSRRMANERISREMHLAHSYLKGRAYHECERTCHEPPGSSKIVSFIPCANDRQKAVMQECLSTWLSSGDLRRWDIEDTGEEAAALTKARRTLQEVEKQLDKTSQDAERWQTAVVEAQQRVKFYDTQMKEQQKTIEAAKEEVKKAEERLQAQKERLAKRPAA